MGWDVSVNLWLIGFYYNSNGKPANHTQIHEIDNCGPHNPLTTGFLLWLVLVPAIACAVQLRGSVLFHGHTTLYRLSPQAGVADGFATVLLLAKSLVLGYSWLQSVAGVLVLRDGVGRGDLWWREEDHAPGTGEMSSGVKGKKKTKKKKKKSTSADTTSGESANDSDETDEDEDAIDTTGFGGENDADSEDSEVRTKLRRALRSLSVERILGLVLVLFGLVRIVAVLSTTASSSGPAKTAAFIGLGYVSSYLTPECLFWSQALGSWVGFYSLNDMPAENMLGLLRLLDPGNGPFAPIEARRSDEAIELEGGAGRRSHTSGGGSSHSSFPPVSGGPAPWSRTLALVATAWAIVEVVVWLTILGMTWTVNKRLFLVSLVAALCVGTGILGKAGAFMGRLTLPRFLPRYANLGNASSMAAMPGGIEFEGDPESIVHSTVILCMRAVSKFTVVNLAAVAWLGVAVSYIVMAFSRERGRDGQPLALPAWLQWFG